MQVQFRKRQMSEVRRSQNYGNALAPRFRRPGFAMKGTFIEDATMQWHDCSRFQWLAEQLASGKSDDGALVASAGGREAIQSLMD